MTWLAIAVVLTTSCSSQPQGLAGGAATVNEPSDPLGWGSKLKRNAGQSLDPLVAHCREGSQQSGSFETFAQPCTLVAQGIRLKFDRYLLDPNKRVAAISGMHPDPSTYNTLRGLMNNQSGVVEYANLCIRLGNDSLPELTITIKNQCEQLNLGLL